jgi:hypothetical protein
MTEKCLLIKTKDNRKFLTHEKNLKSLIEFAKTFNAEIHRVKPQKGQKVLELKTLTKAICQSEYQEDPEYIILKRIFPKPKKSRKDVLKESDVIRNFIREKLVSHQVVSLKDLKAKYKSDKLSDACLCNHLTVVRKQLTEEGFSFRKLGAGTYCLAK